VEPAPTNLPAALPSVTHIGMPEEQIAETAASLSEGQISATVDSESILAPRLRISNLTSQLIDRLVERNLVRLVVTDTSNEVFVLDGTLSVPRGLKPIHDFHNGSLSSRAVMVPKPMTVTLFAYLEANWGFRSTSVRPVGVDAFSNAFDYQILKAQRAAVVESGLSEGGAMTTCRILRIR